MSLISIKGQEQTENSAGQKFSWQLAEISDRHKELQDVDVTARLAAIHRIHDPDGSKTLARLRKAYDE